MSMSVSYSWPAASTTAVTTAQTLVAAGSLTIDGSLAISNVVDFTRLSRTVSLTSVNDLHLVNVTVTGTYRGLAQTETRVGPNNSTVFTTKLFDTVTAVSTDAAAAAMSVGSGTTGQTRWFVFNHHASVLGFSANVVVVSGTITYSLKTTLDDVQTTATPNASTPIVAMTDATTTQLGNYNNTFRYACVAVSASTTGVLSINFTQQGIT